MALSLSQNSSHVSDYEGDDSDGGAGGSIAMDDGSHHHFTYNNDMSSTLPHGNESATIQAIPAPIKPQLPRPPKKLKKSDYPGEVVSKFTNKKYKAKKGSKTVEYPVVLTEDLDEANKRISSLEEKLERYGNYSEDIYKQCKEATDAGWKTSSAAVYQQNKLVADVSKLKTTLMESTQKCQSMKESLKSTTRKLESANTKNDEYVRKLAKQEATIKNLKNELRNTANATGGGQRSNDHDVEILMAKSQVRIAEAQQRELFKEQMRNKRDKASKESKEQRFHMMSGMAGMGGVASSFAGMAANNHGGSNNNPSYDRHRRRCRSRSHSTSSSYSRGRRSRSSSRRSSKKSRHRSSSSHGHHRSYSYDRSPSRDRHHNNNSDYQQSRSYSRSQDSRSNYHHSSSHGYDHDKARSSSRDHHRNNNKDYHGRHQARDHDHSRSHDCNPNSYQEEPRDHSGSNEDHHHPRSHSHGYSHENYPQDESTNGQAATRNMVLESHDSDQQGFGPQNGFPALQPPSPTIHHVHESQNLLFESHPHGTGLDNLVQAAEASKVGGTFQNQSMSNGHD